MTRFLPPLFSFCFASLCCCSSSNTTVASDVVFQEQDGLVAGEAENFFKQTLTETRSFHLTSSTTTPDIKPDSDPPHVNGASGGAYLEILPDTRATHADKLIAGTNFSNKPGKLAVLHYKVNFQTPGRYYVWVRAFSSGGEDNGLHVGIDGEWPDSGQRLQWCKGKNSWRWESKQRTNEVHCGEPHKIFLDVKTEGEHTIAFSMREDGFEFDKWLMTTDRDFARPDDAGPASNIQSRSISKSPQILPRGSDGDGSVVITGETKQWHKVTFTMNGPYAHERDNAPNPHTDLCMSVTLKHTDGTTYTVPGYFAADGNAGESSAESGTAWRAHFAPDRTGQWSYLISFREGSLAAISGKDSGEKIAPFNGQMGEFSIDASDKPIPDLRAHGRLQVVAGKGYLQFAGSKKYFLKAGADAPETLLGYADFDNTIAGNAKKVPLKTWKPHIRDWNQGDPTWKNGKGKGLIGAINYLSGKGCNAFSFLTYNAGGDGDNVWPFAERDDKMHYDCSKLDQWGTVFDHGTAKGMYLHFKMQETENDDEIPESLDGGDLGVERKLYCRELIARFAHNLALNWNIGEENTQSPRQIKDMLNYIADLDAYGHNRVMHTFPRQQDKKYRPLLGDKSKLTGVSLQNSSISDTHHQTVKWVQASAAAGKPWIVAFDESGTAGHGQSPDLGYRGFDGHDKTGKLIYTQHDVRKQTLWGNLMGGGAGVEYYFGYKFVENDLLCEDWRSRDQSWDYCRIAINFFHDNQIPFWEMTNQDSLVENPKHDNSKYCLAKLDDTYVVYLPEGGTTNLDLSDTDGQYSVQWFNPRSGGAMQPGSVTQIEGGDSGNLGESPGDPNQDWIIVVRK